MKTIISILTLLLTINLYSQSEPGWIDNYPIDELYYIGIGSSDTGNKSGDYERALIQARLNLAAEISTSIKAETQIVTRDSSDGRYSESFTEKLNQSVEQNLKELEIVDTFYSRNQGYWVYIRLNKDRWREIQTEEMSLLLVRVQHIINEEYFSNRAATADKLFKLGSVAMLLEKSPYKAILKGDLGVLYSGNIIDFLQSEIYKISSSITMNINETDYETESGEPVDLRFSIKTSDYYTGKIPIIFITDDNETFETFTDINGQARIRINSNELTEGSNILKISIASNELGFPETSEYLNNFIAETKNISISVKSTSIYLRINSNRSNLFFINDPVGTLFTTGIEKFEITDLSSEASYEIIVSLSFTDFPRVLANAPLMAGIDCIISLKGDNRLLYEYKTNTLKDGGLSYEQAYQRAFNKLIIILENDRSYINGIETEINR